MGTRDCIVSDAAKLMARNAGIYGDPVARLRRMARRSAPVTSDFGNRRYLDWFMFISNGVIRSVMRVNQLRN
jgi:hypothetical protein